MDRDSRIVTLTLNPAIDLACEAEAVRPVRKIRTFSERVDPGGGGVNVSRVVRSLGGETLAVVLAGGVTGRLLEELLDECGVPRRSVPVSGRTRISQVVHERASGLEYRFVPEGPMLQDGECRAALDALAEEAGAWVVLSGSLPRGVGPGYYARAAREARARGQQVALDTSGAALRTALEERGLVDLVKPSLGEFEALVGQDLSEPGALEAAAISFARSGAARLVAVTLGHRGALLATAEGRCWRLPAPDVPVRGASGAGDSFVAAMVLALAGGAVPEDAFVWGSAAGGATVAAAGTAHASRAEVEAIHAALRPHLTGG
ncbi:1-phosphofructokinase family hexose kinase [Falsiroseomonas sp.]|uniref:1-phosphofructokinase family hexose kinase n=1 Tax=Falsiroseomonas sp. TaxID=2870721 RepID=UPI003566F4EB